MPEFNRDHVVQQLSAKADTIVSVQKLLLEQLAELPGACCVADDGRDLSRILNEQVKNEGFVREWLRLAQKI